MLQERLSKMCQELGISMPSFDKDKGYTLSLNPTLSLVLQQWEEGFSLSGMISPCPKERREELFTTLMRANFLGQGTGDARIGLDANEKFLTLSCGFPYEMNYQDFKEKVEEFANYLLYWRSELEKLL